MSDKMAVDFTNIPQELKSSCAFCVWKKEKKEGRLTKVPYDPRTGQMARTNAPETFSDFGTAVTAYISNGYAGIGFRVSEGIGAIDIDGCIREDGSLNDVAATVLGIFKDAYFERSPSGTGLRGFFRVAPDFVYDKATYYVNNRKYGLEIYLPETTNRFVTVTGNVYRAGEVSLDMEALRAVLDKFMRRGSRAVNTAIEPYSYLSDEQVIEHAMKSKTGDKFKDLYSGNWQERYASQSEADMALVSMLAFWCGCVEEQIDRVFRTSGLMRDKWDRMSGEATYGQLTIRNAVTTASRIYLPLSGAEVLDLEFEDLDEEGEHPDFNPDLSRVTATLDELHPHTNRRYGLGEIGIGNLFADYYKPIARYNRDRGLWFVYDGRAWRKDQDALAVSELAKLLADKLIIYSLQIQDEDTRKRYLASARKLQNRRNRKTMLDDAKSVFPISQSRFDSSPELLNCQNGTLDLRTMEFRSHDPKDYLTMTAGVDYEPGASCPRWEKFIEEVMCGNMELAGYLQKSLGYAMTGGTSLECLFILYGATSRNGKGTTMETFLRIMGDYGLTSNPELLGAKSGISGNSGPSEDVARLAGKRFVNIAEPDRKMTFNAALVKRMTGNDTLNARMLHENSFDFCPAFKIFINTNHRPNITDTTLFDSGRIKVIEFHRHFSEEEQDKSLKEFFAKPENLSGIFNWCLEGYQRFKAEGLDMPEAVRSAIDDYRQNSDYLGQFIDECLEKNGAYETVASEVYQRYCEWCERNGCYKEGGRNFNNAMSRYFEIKRRRPRGASRTDSAVATFMGCRLLPDEAKAEESVAEFNALEDEIPF